jgi:hypothetical protein
MITVLITQPREDMDPYREASRSRPVRSPLGSEFGPQRPLGTNPKAHGWRKAVTIVGVVWMFMLLLTIPGWFALRSYRRWRDTSDATGLPWPFYFGAFLLAFAIVYLGILYPIGIR